MSLADGLFRATAVYFRKSFNFFFFFSLWEPASKAASLLAERGQEGKEGNPIKDTDYFPKGPDQLIPEPGT